MAASKSTVPDLLRDQDGVAARWQIADAAAVHRIQRRVDAGRWQAPKRGIYVNHSGPLTNGQRLWVALLDCGPGAACRGVTAATLGGLRGHDDARVFVAVPRKRRGPCAPDTHVRRITHLEPLVHPVLAPRRMRMSDAVVDAASMAPTDDDAHAMLTGAVQQKLIGAVQLGEALDRRPRLPRRRLISESLLDIADGCQSLNEIAFVRAIVRAGLPRPTLQIHAATDRRRAYIDGGWPEYDVWYEIDGELHAEVGRWADDLDRSNELAIEQGGTRLRWPGFVVRRHPERAVDQARRALGVRPRI